MTNSIDEIEDADTILIIGSNTSETHPIIGYEVRKAKSKGAALIVIDPRRIDLAEVADLYLQLKPGTNEALLNGFLNVILDENLVDKRFIDLRTEGFEQVAEAVKKYYPAYVEKITGVPADKIVQGARLYANANNATILYAMGITQHTKGTDSVHALSNLVLATGNIGKPSSGLNPLRGQNNVQGACDMGALPDVITGYQKVNDHDVIDKFSDAWGVPLSNEIGLTVTEIFDAILNDKVKFMYIMGENPVLSDANIKHVEDALRKIDFLVVQDIFMTETAKYADVILPAASFAEKEGTFTNTERRVQLLRQAITPPGEAKPDWVIIQALAHNLNLPWNYNTSKDVFDEISELTPSYGGINYKRLDEVGGLQWPCPNKEHEGTKFLHQNSFSRGKGLFKVVEYSPLIEEADEDYPFLLTTGRSLYQYHTGSMTRRVEGLDAFGSEELVMVNINDAKNLDIISGDLIKMSSRRGMIKVKVEVTDVVPPGVVFMTFHYHEAPANLLTSAILDPVAKTPEYKACPVRIEKV